MNTSLAFFLTNNTTQSTTQKAGHQIAHQMGHKDENRYVPQCPKRLPASAPANWQQCSSPRDVAALQPRGSDFFCPVFARGVVLQPRGSDFARGVVLLQPRGSDFARRAVLQPRGAVGVFARDVAALLRNKFNLLLAFVLFKPNSSLFFIPIRIFELF